MSIQYQFQIETELHLDSAEAPQSSRRLLYCIPYLHLRPLTNVFLSFREMGEDLLKKNENAAEQRGCRPSPDAAHTPTPNLQPCNCDGNSADLNLDTKSTMMTSVRART